MMHCPVALDPCVYVVTATIDKRVSDLCPILLNDN